MKKIDLSIVVVNFGSKNRVINFYQSLLKFPPKVAWELIIADNPTKKGGDAESLETYFSAKENVHIVKFSRNLGYGKANNEAVKFAQGEFLAICNPDTEVCAETFDNLLKSLTENDTIGLVVPILRTNSGKLLENCRDFPSVFSLLKRRIFHKSAFLPEDKISKNSRDFVDTDWAQGSFWVLKKNVFEKIGGFDDRFFLFLEDTDFCRRLHQDGLKVQQNLNAEAIHSPNRLSGGFILSAIWRKTFWIHLWSAILYFWKWRKF